ncbi:hypothetical protein GY50_0067 [Dehalococcoides mccartyi GY50]|nr:hypothetical protein GY50_0067 [Dehalococcoides mccartyi GY50]
MNTQTNSQILIPTESIKHACFDEKIIRCTLGDAARKTFG